MQCMGVVNAECELVTVLYENVFDLKKDKESDWLDEGVEKGGRKTKNIWKYLDRCKI